jgi:hypothetical protein
MNNWWFPYGLKRKLTEKIKYTSDNNVNPVTSIFRNSLHIYVIDVGNSNELCFEIKALQSPQYNIHRFGIFFADTPRHADVLIVLGPTTPQMVNPLRETLKQLPKPCGVILIQSNSLMSNFDLRSLLGDNLLVEIKDYEDPGQIIDILLKIMNKKEKKRL